MSGSDLRQLVVHGVEAFAHRELAPHGAAWDRAAAFPEHVVDAFAEQGLLGLAVAEAEGGVDLSMSDRLAVLEALARTDASAALVVATHALAIDVLKTVGASGAAGDGTTVWSTGAPPRGRRCTSARRGDGGWVLSGTIGPVVLAERAAAVVVMATDGSAHPVFVLRRGTWAWDQGVRVGLAMRAARIMNRDVRDEGVDASAYVGAADETAAAYVASVAQLSVGAIALGLGRAGLAAACQHAQERRQFGRRIADFQAIGAKIADMHTTLEAAAGLLHAASQELERGGIAGEAAAARASAFATRHAREACAGSLQIHGGSGYTCAFPIERRLRDARWCESGLVDPGAGRAAIVKALSRRATRA